MISPTNPYDGTRPNPGEAARAGRAAAAEAAAPGAEAPPGPRPWEPIWHDLEELRKSVKFYLTAQADATKSKVRRLVMTALLGVVGAIVGVTSLVMCVVLAMLGISNGLSALLGGRVWAGELIAGFGILFIIAAALGIAIGSAKSAAHRKTLEKYEQLRRDQKIAFERSAAERVAAAHR